MISSTLPNPSPRELSKPAAPWLKTDANGPSNLKIIVNEQGKKSGIQRTLHWVYLYSFIAKSLLAFISEGKL